MGFALRKGEGIHRIRGRTASELSAFAGPMNLSDLDVDFEGRLREVLPDAARYFGMHLPDNYQIEMQMTVHGDSNYFKIHNDNATPRTANAF